MLHSLSEQLRDDCMEAVVADFLNDGKQCSRGLGVDVRLEVERRLRSESVSAVGFDEGAQKL